MDATDPTPAPGTRRVITEEQKALVKEAAQEPVERLAKKVGHALGYYVIPAWAVTTALSLTAALIKYLLS